MTNSFDLRAHGISVSEIHRNLALGALCEHAIRYEKDARIVENRALVTATADKRTGKSSLFFGLSGTGKTTLWTTIG
jgi:phosphoenolpyruvate carboxykinase (ATP)